MTPRAAAWSSPRPSTAPLLAAAVAGRARECADQQVAHLRRTVEVVLLEASDLTSHGRLVRRAAGDDATPTSTTERQDDHG